MTVQDARQRATNFFSKRKKGIALNIAIDAVSSFGIGFAAYFFHAQHLALYKIMLVWAISPLASLPIVFFINQWDTRKFLRLGVLASIGASLSLLFYSPYSYLLFGIFSGLILGLFWVSFNYCFFAGSADHQHAKDSSLYFILGPLVGIVMPPLGALVIDSFSYHVLFSITCVAMFIPFLLIHGKYFDHKETIIFKDADRAFSGIRLIAFFDGALHFFQGHFLTIYILLFLKTEYEFGSLLSYLAIISLSVSFVLSYVSDKYKKRTQILYPLLLLMATIIMLIPSIKNLALLVPVIGLYAVLDNLSLPIRFATHIDMGTKDTGFWRMSEFYGNIGRTILFALAAFFLYIGNYWVPFALFAVMTAVFPFIISHKLQRMHR
jgi:MFS family permease